MSKESEQTAQGAQEKKPVIAKAGELRKSHAQSIVSRPKWQRGNKRACVQEKTSESDIDAAPN